MTTPNGIYCRKCGYDLRASKERCPECGRGFDPNDKKTFRRKPLRGPWVRWLRRVAILLLTMLIVLAGSWGWFYWGWYQEEQAIKAPDFDGGVDYEPLIWPRLRKNLGHIGFVFDRVDRLSLMGARTIPKASGQLLHIRRIAVCMPDSSDLSPLADYDSLEELEILECPVTDVRPLSRLKRLRYLDLSGSGVVDLSPLYGMKSLRTLILRNDVYGVRIEAIRREFPGCDVILY